MARDNPPIASPDGEIYGPAAASDSAGFLKNDSGSGSNAVLPEELKGFNVGAFLCPVLFASANGLQFWAVFAGLIITYISTFAGMRVSETEGYEAFLLLGVPFAATLGFLGNSLAWKSHGW